MKMRGWSVCLLVLCCWLYVYTSTVRASTYGVVGPVQFAAVTKPKKAIEASKTYVFYNNGIVSMVVQPQLRSRVMKLGLIMTFPSVPVVRTVSASIFTHIASAIDPPSFQLSLRGWHSDLSGRKPQIKTLFKGSDLLRHPSVRVIRREEVGMYQITVLRARRSWALKRWMQRHGFRFPKGMARLCASYIKKGWVFVLVKVKARVQGLGKRGRTLASDAVSQALGFRFRARKLVFPTRLSALTPGTGRHLIYVLAKTGKALRGLPSSFVRLQLSGQSLYNHLTKPLPVFVLHGKPKDMKAYHWHQLRYQRDPSRYTRLAKALFVADLEASSTAQLTLRYEEQYKALLRVGEGLGLRDKRFEALCRRTLKGTHPAFTTQQRRTLKSMTMTVIDGNFPRRVLQRQDLHLVAYRKPRVPKAKQRYSVRLAKMVPVEKGILLRGRSPFSTPSRRVVGQKLPILPTTSSPLLDRKYPMYRLILRTETPKYVKSSIARLLRAGQKAVPFLRAALQHDPSLVRRAWALVAMGRMRGAVIDKSLIQASKNWKDPVIQIFSIALRIRRARTSKALVDLLPLYGFLPSIKTLFTTRLIAAFQKQQKPRLVSFLLAARVPAFQRHFHRRIAAYPSSAFLRLLLQHTDPSVRRRAASYLSIRAKQDSSVPLTLIRALRFRVGAKDVPWSGGPLLLPRVDWQGNEARTLSGALVAWLLWAYRKKKMKLCQNICRILRNWGLAHAAGYYAVQGNYDAPTWISTWGRAVGRRAVLELLKAQGLDQNKAYLSLLKHLR